MNENDLMAGGVATHQLHDAAGAVKLFCEKSQQRFVGRRVHRWGGYRDLQLIAQCSANFILRGARLDFDRQADSVFLDLDEARHPHRFTDETARLTAKLERIPPLRALPSPIRWERGQ